MKLFLDDLRNAPDNSWVIVRNYYDCIDILTTGKVKVSSLDHDLGTDLTGYDVAKAMMKYKTLSFDWPVPKTLVHSCNLIGRDNIISCLKSIDKHFSTNCCVPPIEYSNYGIVSVPNLIGDPSNDK